MCGKRRRTVSLDEPNDRYLEDPDLNASGLINSLVSHFRRKGRIVDVALGMRLEQTKQEIEDTEAEIARLQSRLSELESERDRLEAKLRDMEDRQEEAIDEFLNLSGGPELDPENPAVKNYAQKANMTPQRFIEEVRART